MKTALASRTDVRHDIADGFAELVVPHFESPEATQFGIDLRRLSTSDKKSPFELLNRFRASPRAPHSPILALGAALVRHGVSLQVAAAAACVAPGEPPPASRTAPTPHGPGIVDQDPKRLREAARHLALESNIGSRGSPLKFVNA